ncbi:MAG: hypothetical protein SO072_09430 [Dysosmobacter sp.]|nr:hypothetical protein [Dysosmobacter sp.]
MKKSNFVALILGTIGIVFFALGMCMCMIPEWGMFQQGIICGVIGLAVLLLTLFIWRKMEGKAPIKISAKTLASAVVGVLGALLLGVGMCMVMVFSKMVMGIVIGLIGIIVLLMLIPLTKGIHD